MATGTNPRPPSRASFAGRRLAGVVRKLPPRSGDRNDRLSLEGSHERRREDRAGWHRHADPSVRQTGRGLSALCAPPRGVTVRVGRVRIGLGRQHQLVAEPVPARVVPEDLL